MGYRYSITLALLAASLLGSTHHPAHRPRRSASTVPRAESLYSWHALRRTRDILILHLLELRRERLGRLERLLRAGTPIGCLLRDPLLSARTEPPPANSRRHDDCTTTSRERGAHEPRRNHRRPGERLRPPRREANLGLGVYRFLAPYDRRGVGERPRQSAPCKIDHGATHRRDKQSSTGSGSSKRRCDLPEVRPVRVGFFPDWNSRCRVDRYRHSRDLQRRSWRKGEFQADLVRGDERLGRLFARRTDRFHPSRAPWPRRHRERDGSLPKLALARGGIPAREY